MQPEESFEGPCSGTGGMVRVGGTPGISGRKMNNGRKESEENAESKRVFEGYIWQLDLDGFSR